MSDGTGSAQGSSVVEAGGGYAGAASGSASGSSVVAAASTIVLAQSSQLSMQEVVQKAPVVRASQIAMMSMYGIPAEFAFSSQFVMQTLTQITAKFVYSSELVEQTLGNGMTVAQSSQIVMLTLVRANPERRKMRAWTFFQDGHHFYVLHLGNLTTLVFDTLTRKWSEWNTKTFNNWKANYGVNWNEDVIAGAIDGNELYTVSADVDTDEGLPIASVITGGYPMRMRGSATCDEVMVTSSVGMRTSDVGATMGLRTSDDYGLNWNDWGTLDLSTATPRTQVSWQSLGEIRAPGRIFEITDSGAAKRINSLDLYSRDIQ